MTAVVHDRYGPPEVLRIEGVALSQSVTAHLRPFVANVEKLTRVEVHPRRRAGDGEREGRQR